MTAIALANIRRFFRSYLQQEMYHLEVMHALAEGLPWYVPNEGLEAIPVALAQAVFGFDEVSFMADGPPAVPYAELAAHLKQCIDSETTICLVEPPLQLSQLPEPLSEPLSICHADERDTAVLGATADSDHHQRRWILRWRRLYPNSGEMQLFLFDIDNDRVYLTPSASKTRTFADLLAELAAVLPVEALYEPEQRLGCFRAMASSALRPVLPGQ
jgi:hypothetical protein